MMPRTMQRAAATVRARITGETLAEAAAGISRGPGHGLDECTAEQRRFRCLLALGLLNAGAIGASQRAWGIFDSTLYTITVSPRYDLLKWVCNAPRNVALRLVPWPGHDSGVPGLRILASDAEGYHLAHTPTGARMLISSLRGTQFPRPGRLFDRDEQAAGATCPLSGYERVALASVPPMTPAAEMLLAGLSTRLDARDPDGRWAIGTWYGDPLRRPGRAAFTGQANRRLWGGGDYWELRWDGHPPAADLAAALTDPRTALAGVQITAVDDGTYTATLDRTELNFGPALR